METNSIVIDARRLLCPMPVIRTQNAIADLPTGTQLTVICTDPGALHDIPAWVRIHGHQLISTETKEREYIIHLIVGNKS